MDFLSEIWGWLQNFLTSLQLPNLPQLPQGIPLTFLLVGAAVGLFLLWILLKNALMAVLVLVGLGVLWFLLAPLNSIVLFSQSGLTLTALDGALVAILAVGAYILSKSKGRK